MHSIPSKHIDELHLPLLLSSWACMSWRASVFLNLGWTTMAPNKNKLSNAALVANVTWGWWVCARGWWVCRSGCRKSELVEQIPSNKYIMKNTWPKAKVQLAWIMHKAQHNLEQKTWNLCLFVFWTLNMILWTGSSSGRVHRCMRNGHWNISKEYLDLHHTVR